jgi:leucyl aminopeptidase
MKITSKDTSSSLSKTPLLVLFGFEEEELLLPTGVQCPASAREDFRGKFRDVRLADAEGPAGRLLLIGLGKRAECDREKLRRAAALAVKRAEAVGVASAAMWADERVIEVGCGDEPSGHTMAEAVVMGSYRFDRLKSKPTKRKLGALALWGPGVNSPTACAGARSTAAPTASPAICRTCRVTT